MHLVIDMSFFTVSFSRFAPSRTTSLVQDSFYEPSAQPFSESEKPLSDGHLQG